MQPCERPVVECKGLEVCLNGRTVLEDITFCVDRGSFVAIIGPNGAGKTTLLRTMLNLTEKRRGEVLIFGMAPRALGPRRSLVGYVPQRLSFDPLFPVSALDVVLMGRLGRKTLFRRFGPDDRRMAGERLEEVGLGGLETRRMSELSGGEQRRVLLARALSSNPSLLLLDEPVAGLDVAGQFMFYDLLKELRAERGLTVIVVSHDVVAISGYADEVICINRTMHVHGKPTDVLKTAVLSQAYRCELDLVSRPVPMSFNAIEGDIEAGGYRR